MSDASQARLIRVRELWERSKAAQLEIGKLLYEERAERLSVGGRGVINGFHQWLREAGIPKTSAYRRIAEYEISIGERAEENTFDKPVPDGTPLPDHWQPVPAHLQPKELKDYRLEPPKKQVHQDHRTGGWWEGLYYQLNRMVPMTGDGCEHVLVAKLDDARTQPANTLAERNMMFCVVRLLEEISKDFARRAEELRPLAPKSIELAAPPAADEQPELNENEPEADAPEERPARTRAMKLAQTEAWLREYLKDGPRPMPYLPSYVLMGYGDSTGDTYGPLSQQPRGVPIADVHGNPLPCLPPVGVLTKTMAQALKNVGAETINDGPRGGRRWHMKTESPVDEHLQPGSLSIQ